MADRRKEARDFTAEIKKQEEILESHNETALSYKQAQQRIVELKKEEAELQKKIADSIDDQVKVGKKHLAIEKELDRTLALQEKSFSSRIQSLLKGNIASAVGLKSTRAHEQAQRNLAEEHKNVSDELAKTKLSQEQQNDLLDIASQIQKGELTDQESITAAIKEKGGGELENVNIMGKNIFM